MELVRWMLPWRSVDENQSVIINTLSTSQWPVMLLETQILLPTFEDSVAHVWNIGTYLSLSKVKILWSSEGFSSNILTSYFLTITIWLSHWWIKSNSSLSSSDLPLFLLQALFSSSSPEMKYRITLNSDVYIPCLII